MSHFAVTKSITFQAAHFAPSEKAGQCHRMHGHSYKVTICVSLDAELRDKETGFSVPYSELNRFLKSIHDAYDHRTLNDLPEFQEDTSTEELCLEIASWYRCFVLDIHPRAKLWWVQVEEGNDASTRYYP